MKTLCIYHGGCNDGFGSAYLVNHFLGDKVDFHYGIYQKEPPDCTDRDVIIVDFSYKRPVMEEIITHANSVTVLDHHKSAEAELAPLLQSGELKGQFDMDRSGVAMTWDWFCSTPEALPWLFAYIQDRDLWRKRLPNCDEIIMALRSYPQKFEVWRSIIDAGKDALLADGIAIHRYYRTIIDDLKRNAIPQNIAGITVPVVNSPYHFASELAGELAEGEPFAACYWNHAYGTTYSLRSRDDGHDVSAIAAQYGGGGHRNAAGFKVDAPLKEIDRSGDK